MAICVMQDGQSNEITSDCRFVFLEYSEYQAIIQRETPHSSPLEMSRQDAVQLGVSIAAIWITCAVIKSIYSRFL